MTREPMAVLPVRRLGSTGLSVTSVSFGAASIGNLGKATSDEDAAAAVARAWDRGIRYFDTAPHYGLGLSERRLGAALRGRPREEYVVSTKVGRLLEPNPEPTPWDTDGFRVPGDVRRRWDFSKSGMRRSVDESLVRLGLDSIDVVYAHDPDQFRESAAREALTGLAELRSEGLVHAIGVGTNTAVQLPELFRAGLLDVAMLAGRFTLLEPTGAGAALEAARRANAAIVAAGVFNSGLLSRRSPSESATYEYAPAPPHLLERARRLASICEDHGTTLPAAAIAFPLRDPVVASVTLGMRSAQQVDGNLDAFEAPVPQELWDAAAAAGLLAEP